MKKSVLGKGLSALIPTAGDGNGIPVREYNGEKAETLHNVVEIPLEDICLNPSQPRKRIDQETLAQLAESIKEFGLIQPVIVTRKEGIYHLVVGERRLRAFKQLNIPKIPAIVKESSWEEMLKIALVENIQREDLNPVEESRAYKLLMDEYSLSQDQLAESLGKSRSYIANMIRLLNLPVPILSDLESGSLSVGHARSLLGLEDPILIMKLADRIKKKNLSVRQTEELVRELKEKSRHEKGSLLEEEPALTSFEKSINRIQEGLMEKFSTKVHIKSKGDGGKIEIFYNSQEDFSRILENLGVWNTGEQKSEREEEIREEIPN